ncbi:FkbM family methyltransferase [Spongiactinospora sp. 9N601]|uniref:FkbM family methyltransferase n=1 Tax=Spongiactinospora sp. 9N601 TaxID=3375149 RepID=UPI0037C70C22
MKEGIGMPSSKEGSDNSGPRQGVPELFEVKAAAVSLGVRSLARFTPWLESELLGVRSLTGPGGTCVDVGAAAGLYTAELARAVGPGGVVHSVEPLVFAHAVPSRLLGLRDHPNVVRHALALGETEGKSVMSVPIRNGRMVTGRSFVVSGAFGLGQNREFDEHIEVVVAMRTLDGLCESAGIGQVDFMKIDVEGRELQVLKGGAALIERCAPALLLEVEQRHLSRYGTHTGDLLSWLADHGYTMRAWRNGTWQKVPDLSPAHRNYLFTAKDPAGR